MHFFTQISFNEKIKLIVTTLAAAYLIFACARIMHPEGGPKDLNQPKLVSTYPMHGSTMFKGRKLTLTFDKEVDQKGMYTKLKISPSIKQEESRGYTYKTRGKTIELELEKELDADKTYTFNFDDCIVDITEGNAAENIVLTFSTGPEIDKMKTEGIVVDTLTNIPVSNAYVFFYALDESIPFEDQNKILTEEPTYFIKTDGNGRFSISNLKEGDYKVYAKYNDAGVFKFNPAKDKCGVLPYPVSLKKDGSDDFLVIKIVEADLSELKLLKAIPRGPHFEIKFNKPIIEYSFDNPNLCTILSEDKRSIYIFSTQRDRTDGEVILQTMLLAHDNAGESIEQEVALVLNSNNNNHIKPHFTISPPPPNSNLPSNFITSIKSLKPILSLEQIDKNKILIYLNDKPIFLPEENFSIDISEHKINISYDLSSEELNFEEDVNLYLAIAEGAIKDTDGGTISNTTHPYKVANPKKFGSISGSIYSSGLGCGYTVQLVGLDGKIVDEIHSSDMEDVCYKFTLVRPGKYLLRILCFSPGNRYWSPGNILKNKPTDRVEIYDSLIEVLENWEVDGINFYLSSVNTG